MTPKLLISLFLLLLLISCDSIDDEVYPIVGIYRSHIVSVAGPFDMIVSSDNGKKLSIETLFDGSEYYTISAKIEDEKNGKNNIIIDNQIISGIEICGDGFYQNGTIELKYQMDLGHNKRDYALVGAK